MLLLSGDFKGCGCLSSVELRLQLQSYISNSETVQIDYSKENLPLQISSSLLHTYVQSQLVGKCLTLGNTIAIPVPVPVLSLFSSPFLSKNSQDENENGNENQNENTTSTSPATSKVKFLCKCVNLKKDEQMRSEGIVSHKTRISFKFVAQDQFDSCGNNNGPRVLANLDTYDPVCREKLRHFIKNAFQFDSMSNGLNKLRTSSILVHGISGTGKSTLVKAVCAESGLSVVEVDMLSYVHVESDVLFRQLVQENFGNVILVDNADCWLGSQYGISHLLLLQFVALCSQTDVYENANVLFVAVANDPSNIHPALSRCFDERIEAQVPDVDHRLLIWKTFVHETNVASELNSISHGFVGGDISNICKKATQEANTYEQYISNVYKLVNSTKPASIRHSNSNWTTISPENIGVSFDDIGGLEEVKQSLQEMLVWPRVYKNEFCILGIEPPKGVLLHGPPGTGKTMLASAVAKQAEANFLSISISDVIRGEIGEGEKAVANIFRVARRVAPCVLFFDEFQALFGNRSESGSVGRKLVSQLLLEMDALELVQRHEDYNGKRIILIGATNVPEKIDPALLRPGRFDRMIYVPVPDENARKQILEAIRKEMGCWDEDVDINALIRLTPFLTGADIRNLCSKAALEAFRENCLDDDITKIHLQHFERLLTRDITTSGRNSNKVMLLLLEELE